MAEPNTALMEIRVAAFQVSDAGELALLVHEADAGPGLPTSGVGRSQPLPVAGMALVGRTVDPRGVRLLESLPAVSPPGPEDPAAGRLVAAPLLALVAAGAPVRSAGPATFRPLRPGAGGELRSGPAELDAADRAVVEVALTRLHELVLGTSAGLALAATEFTLSELGRVYSAALGAPVDHVKFGRSIQRRGWIERVGRTVETRHAPGRPAELYRSAVSGVVPADPVCTARP